MFKLDDGRDRCEDCYSISINKNGECNECKDRDEMVKNKTSYKDITLSDRSLSDMFEEDLVQYSQHKKDKFSSLSATKGFKYSFKDASLKKFLRLKWYATDEIKRLMVMYPEHF